jgi:hypothetical protein
MPRLSASEHFSTLRPSVSACQHVSKDLRMRKLNC